jgi:tetratricopeptide (TPR) repeat protein
MERRNHIVRFVLSISSLLILTMAFSMTLAAAASSARPAVAIADQRYSRRCEPGMANTLIAGLEEANRATPGECGILWRLSRAYWFKSTRVPENDKKARLELLDQGRAYAEEATVADPKSANAYYWLAASIAQAGQIKGILQSLASVKPTKMALDKGLEADPEHASCHYLMAELYLQLPGAPLSIGNKKKAVEEARLAVKYDPSESCHHLVLGRALIATKQYDEARAALNRLIEMKVSKEDPEGFKRDQDAAREELKSIAGK